MAADHLKGPDEKYCSECGTIIRAKAEICPHCGVRQGGPSLLATTPGEKNKLVAAILALLLGGLGIHKFYLGRTGAGILYVLFCWTGIPSIIGLIEGVSYLTMSDEDFAAKFG